MIKYTYITVLVVSLFYLHPTSAQTIVGNPSAMFTLPVGSVLMFDKVPDPMPAGWEKCGYIRVERAESELDKPHMDHEYICLHKIK